MIVLMKNVDLWITESLKWYTRLKAGNWWDNEHEFNEFLNYCNKLKKLMLGYCKCSI
jgi:hypothetical protein